MDREIEKQKLLVDRMKILSRLQEIEEQERLEDNKKLVGRYFKNWVDNNYQYTIYVEVTKIDKIGNLLGRYFKVFDDGWVEFSNPNYLAIVDEHVSSKNEISKDRFVTTYLGIINRLNSNIIKEE